MVKTNIRNPVPFFLLGAIALEHNNIAKAIELFSKAEALDPSAAIYPAYSAKALLALRRAEDAKLAADKAAALKGQDDHVFDLLGVIYSRIGFHGLAINMFEKAVALDFNQSNYHYNLGASAQFMGDFGKAKAAYKACLEIEPDSYKALASLCALETQTIENNFLEKLVSLFETFQDDEDARQQIGHAAAKTLEDLGRHEDSYDWLVKAKAQKRSRYRFDKDAGSATFEAAKRTSHALKTAKNSPQDAPIFIVGLPRTGTTLIDRILSSHSEVSSAGELNDFAELIKAAAGTASNMVLDADTLSACQHIDLAQIGRSYAQRTNLRAGRTAFMIDKMPLNFFYAGLIHQALPNARIIALRRGAMDSCLSNFRQLLSTQESFYNYTLEIEDTAFFYREFDALMTHWRGTIPADRFMEVRYEDVVLDQENQTRRLLDFCELGWEETCMRFHENSAPVSTASSVQVRQPLYSGSIGRWKKYGQKLERLKNALGDLADIEPNQER